MVLVTGGSRGIGRAIAERFVSDGHRVAVTSRSGGGPDGALALSCDQTDSEQVDLCFDRVEAELGTVEVLVVNAGVTRDKLIARMGWEDWQEVVDLNLGGAFRMTKRAVRSMTRNRFGRVILISSVVAMLGSPGQANYAASKAGLVGFARSLARELGGRGVTANVVAPGFIETDMTAALAKEVVDGYRARIPAGRLGQVADVAAAVAFLAGDGAGYVNGALLPVDGGLGMGH